jgi:hypothetical protein
MVNLRSHLVRNKIGIYEDTSWFEDTLGLTKAQKSVFVECYGGGGKGAPRVIEVPATPPPAPSAPSTPMAAGDKGFDEATMEEFTDEEEEKRTRKAMTQGAKSLQIPLGSASGSNVGTA